MGSDERQYRCYVCRRKYFPDQMGRMRLPLTNVRFQEPWYKPVCVTCYDAIITSWALEIKQPPPVLHGF